ncbi:diguanylate cyclase [Cellvibrio polysaccharolyticus]|uniref:diguanylate cyclase n=1 Tax=Cellvibrio polysaccharolyticus TaxID=2082724 RepID=A0A928V3H3_9GAMM|nr:diguanylate cyclase [Cellvibrio polysaccharolyticus]MBE8718060.1 diguanylate cyclase [Cellvibrio polysaccharolyticus]
MKELSGRGARFVKRIYPARVIGLGLGFLAIAVAIHPLAHPPVLWLLLFLNGFVWPHVAYQIALRSPNPYQTERQSFLIDSGTAGVWLVAMGFNPIPGALVTMMLWMNNMAAGGPVLFLKGALASVAGVLIGGLVLGFQLHINTDMQVVLACLPLLLIYPLMIGGIAWRLAIQLSEQKKALQHLSRIDALTGLYNRGYWQARAQEEQERMKRQQGNASLIMLDIDHFKNINDHHGHGTGDIILQEIAKILLHTSRQVDIAGRYGGEEFVILLPDTDKAGAMQVAERLRTTIALHHFIDTSGPIAQTINSTISIGVADLSQVGNFSEWVRAADMALYTAKRHGRNRSICFQQYMVSNRPSCESA